MMPKGFRNVTAGSISSVTSSPPVVVPFSGSQVNLSPGMLKTGAAMTAQSDEWGPRKMMVSGAGVDDNREIESVGAPAIGLKLNAFLVRVRRKIKESPVFPPFRLTIWEKGRDGLLNEMMRAGGLGDCEIPIGLYVLTFDTPGESPYASDEPLSIEAGGKSARIEKMRVYADGRTVILVRLLENPLPILVLIGAAAAGVGIAGFGVSSVLHSVDKVVIDTTDNAIRLGIIGGVGFIGYKIGKRIGVF